MIRPARSQRRCSRSCRREDHVGVCFDTSVPWMPIATPMLARSGRGVVHAVAVMAPRGRWPSRIDDPGLVLRRNAAAHLQLLGLRRELGVAHTLDLGPVSTNRRESGCRSRGQWPRRSPCDAPVTMTSSARLRSRPDRLDTSGAPGRSCRAGRRRSGSFSTVSGWGWRDAIERPVSAREKRSAWLARSRSVEHLAALCSPSGTRFAVFGLCVQRSRTTSARLSQGESRRVVRAPRRSRLRCGWSSSACGRNRTGFPAPEAGPFRDRALEAGLHPHHRHRALLGSPMMRQDCVPLSSVLRSSAASLQSRAPCRSASHPDRRQSRRACLRAELPLGV